MVPAALRRCGRFADGWLPSSCTPDGGGCRPSEVIDEAAAEVGPGHQPRALRGVDRLRRPPAHRRRRTGRCRRAGGASTRRRWCRWASTGCGTMLERFLEVGFSKFVVRPLEHARLVAGRARGPGRRRPRPPDMTAEPTARARVRGVRRPRAARPQWPRSSRHGDRVDQHRAGHRGGARARTPGTVRLPRRVDPPGPHRHLDARQAAADGAVRPTTIGLQHASGPRVAGTLRDLGLPLPEGWRITQDHPRRGAGGTGAGRRRQPGGDDWLLGAAAAVCAVPTTGRWAASVHAGPRLDARRASVRRPGRSALWRNRVDGIGRSSSWERSGAC